MDKYSRDIGKGLLEFLVDSGAIEYGSVISGSTVRLFLGIKEPQGPISYQDAIKHSKEAALLELAAIDYVRNVLLGQGMYLGQDKGDYRIYLPSENAKQIEAYMGSADKKLRRALKLSRSTPKSDMVAVDNTDVRLLAKQEEIRRHRKHSDLLK